MIDEALTEPAAIDLAKGLKALGDPVRLFFNVNNQAELEFAERLARSH